MDNSIKKAMDETARRRKLQIAHNTQNNITPTTINKAITGVFDEIFGKENAKMKNFDRPKKTCYQKNSKK